MKRIIKDSFVLFLITAIAGLLLAIINEVTKGPIMEQQIQAKADACRAVFSEASSFESYSPVDYAGHGQYVVFPEVYKALDAEGNLLGFVINVTTTEGYGGEIEFAMGVRLDRHLNGISILSSSETVGLGLEAENVLVPQFADKSVEAFTYTKTGSSSDSEIDAISSATITTNAFVNAVNAGLEYFDFIISHWG